MSTFLTAATTLERILSVAGPLILALVGKDQEKLAGKVLDASYAAIDYARMTIKGGQFFAAELREIADELEAIQARGGSNEQDFDLMADRVGDKTERLLAVVAKRQLDAAAKAAK